MKTEEEEEAAAALSVKRGERLNKKHEQQRPHMHQTASHQTHGAGYGFGKNGS